MQATTYEHTDELPAKSQACVDAGKPAIEITPFDTQEAAANAVVLGQADAMSADSPVTGYAIAQTDGKLVQAGEVFDSAPYGFPVKKAPSSRRPCRPRCSRSSTTAPTATSSPSGASRPVA